MALFLLLAFFSLTSVLTSNQVLSHKECALGEEFWCQDLDSAAQCDKVSYCTQYVWGEFDQEALEGESPRIKCGICAKLMRTVKKVVGDTTDTDEISEKLDSVCNNMSRLIRWACRRVMKRYKDRITDALSNGSDAKAVCVLLGMCKSPDSV